jgi:hypothetical protein
MTEYDKKWNMKYEQLVKFKQEKGHCMVPPRYEQNNSLGMWVSTQRTFLRNNKIRQDRKRILDAIGFAWKADYTHFKPDDKLWIHQCKKLVEFKRKKGHCMVPFRYEEDNSLGIWVSTQRKHHNNNKIRLDRKEILDQIGFAWKGCTPAPRSSSSSSTTDVRILFIGLSHALVRSFGQIMFLTLVIFCF